MYTLLPASPIAVMSAIISMLVASRDGMGKPPSLLCAGLVLLAKPTAPAAMASRTMICISLISCAVASLLQASGRFQLGDLGNLRIKMGVTIYDAGHQRQTRAINGVMCIFRYISSYSPFLTCV